MCSHDDFPRWKTAYNVLVGSAFLGTGALVTLAVGLGWLDFFLGALLVGLVLTVATACPRCAYFGRRCALGIGKLVPVLRGRGRREEFCRTWPQLMAIVCLMVATTVALACAIRLCLAGAWSIPAVHVAAMLAFVLPHPRWMCGRCLQREQGLCPIGSRLARPAERP